MEVEHDLDGSAHNPENDTLIAPPPLRRLQTCPNDCSGNGVCSAEGLCICVDGFNNSDCSLLCGSPCLDCAGSPTSCTSCRNDTGLGLLELDSCVEKCSDHYFIAGDHCIECADQCSVCEISPDHCLICAADYPYWYKYDCDVQCPPRTYAQSPYKTCKDCVKGCLSCPNNVCEACDQAMNY